jgi:hypothetical protein
VALTATGLPPGATYTFSPVIIPAGSGRQRRVCRSGLAWVFPGRRSYRGVRGQLEYTRAVASPGFRHIRPPVHLPQPSLFPAMRRLPKVWLASYTASTRPFPPTPAPPPAPPTRWRRWLAEGWTSPSTITSQSGPSRRTTASRNCPIASRPIRIFSATPRPGGR